MQHRLPLVLLVILAVALASLAPALGQTADPALAKLPPDDLTDPPPLFAFEQYPPTASDNVVLQWDEELLQAVRALPPGPTVTARAISVVHTAIFDAWAAYDARALGTRLRGSLRRPAAERTLENKKRRSASRPTRPWSTCSRPGSPTSPSRCATSTTRSTAPTSRPRPPSAPPPPKR